MLFRPRGNRPIIFTNKPESFLSDKHGWAEFLPSRLKTPAFAGTRRVPWVIVGGGVTGLSAARRLAENNPDDEILLVDARQIGQSASGRNSGFAVNYSQFPGAFDPHKKGEYQRINRINQAGLSFLRADVRNNAIECSWFEDGFHHAAADEKALLECDHYQGYLEGLDIPYTELDREDLFERLGSTHYKRGFHIPQGVLLQPAALVRGLADTLPGNVSVYECSPVLRIAYEKQLSLQLPQGQIVADKVILATNYEVSKLGILNRYLAGITLSGSFTRVLTSDEVASLGTLHQWGVLSMHAAGATVRLTADGRICLRNCAEYLGANLLSEQQLRQRQSIHRDSFVRRFPQLAHVPFEYAWSGVEGISRNSTNFFGQQKENLYFAGGYNGSGVSRGTAFGAALADYVIGGQSELITDCLNSTTAAWLPPRPFLDIGAAFSIRSQFTGVGLDR